MSKRCGYLTREAIKITKLNMNHELDEILEEYFGNMDIETLKDWLIQKEGEHGIRR